MTPQQHDTRIDEDGSRFIASCPCGWQRSTGFGRKQVIPISRDNAFLLSLELATNHRDGAA